MRWRTWGNSGVRNYKKMKWHKWFAWRPVVVGKEYFSYSLSRIWAWFEWVERRGKYKHLIGCWKYEYRERKEEVYDTK